MIDHDPGTGGTDVRRTTDVKHLPIWVMNPLQKTVPITHFELRTVYYRKHSESANLRHAAILNFVESWIFYAKIT